MGEVLLDSENLFFGFGWTPRATAQKQRREFLGRFGAPPPTSEEWDILGVEDLARSATHALADWARRHFAAYDVTVDQALSYGKMDGGVRAVLVALAVEGYRHLDVRWGANVAETAILTRLQRSRWARGPYVIGSSDAVVLDRLCAAMAIHPELRAVIVMRPDVYHRCRWSWFLSTDPEREARFPQLSRYGEGHVALHRITDAYLASLRGTATRRAHPAGPKQDQAAPTPDQTAPTLDNLWRTWRRYRRPPVPTAQRPLSSAAWVNACRKRAIPASVFRPLRDGLGELYGDAFETGDGPVSWGLACQTAVSVPLVRAHPVAAPDGLDPTSLAGYREAWMRLMSRPPLDDTDK